MKKCAILITRADFTKSVKWILPFQPLFIGLEVIAPTIVSHPL